MRASVLLVVLAAFAPAQDLSYLDLLKEGYRLAPAEIARMENALLNDPHDLSTRARLMSHYYQHVISQRRVAHALWVIEHHPGSKLAGSPVAAVSRWDVLNTRSDYEAARLLWLKQIEARANDAAVLSNAGAFFIDEEPKRAGELLLKAWQLDTSNKMRLAAIVRLYTQVLSDCEFQLDNPAFGRPCRDSAWAHEVKTRLDATASVELARAVADSLSKTGQPPYPSGVWRDPAFVERLRHRQ